MPEFSRADRRESSVQLRRKLVYEALLASKLKSFFRRQSTEIVKRFYSDGTMLDASIFNSELEQILLKHHNDVSKWYADRQLKAVSAVIGAASGDALSSRNAIIASAILAMVRDNVASDVDYLAKDSNAEIEKITSDDDNDEAAALLLLLSRSAVRADRHATNINQRNIEQTKQVVSDKTQAAIAISSIKTVIVRQKKTWSAIIDKVTRSWHAAANGMKILASEPFEIAGEFLMYPGDYSLGATAKNLERCRCVSIFSTEIAK